MSNAHTHVSTCTFTCPQSPLHVITQSCHRIAWHIDDYGWFCVSIYLYLPYHALSEMWTPLDDWDDFTTNQELYGKLEPVSTRLRKRRLAFIGHSCRMRQYAPQPLG